MKAQRIDTPEKRQIVIEHCKKYKGIPNRTLAKMLYAKYPHLFYTLESCRSAVRMRRGNHGKSHRAELKTNPELFRPNQPAGFVWTMPPSLARPWEPFVLNTRKNLIVADIHAPFHDEDALGIVIDFGKKYKPDAIVIAGDFVDFYSISHYCHNPKEPDLIAEMNSARALLGYFRQEFPDSRIIYKLGNHDERWRKYIFQKCGELWKVPGLQLKTLLTSRIVEAETDDDEPQIIKEVDRIEFVDDQRKIQFDKLDILHGHEFGKGSNSPVNPARGSFLKLIECSLTAHLHRSSSHTEPSSRGRIISCWSIGCLCDLHPDYARINKWNHGFATTELTGRGRFVVDNYKILDGEIVRA